MGSSDLLKEHHTTWNPIKACRLCCLSIKPLDQFCCGCPLWAGVSLVLFFNFFESLVYITSAVMNVILRVPTNIGQGIDLNVIAFNTAYALISLPFLLAGYWGVKYEKEVHLRLYFYYQSFTWCMDTVFLVIAFFLRDSCKAIPDVLKHAGNAFACGTMRIAVLTFFVIVMIFELYGAYAVWSLCEELELKNSTQDFDELLRANARSKKQKAEGLGSGLFGTAFAGSYHSYPVFYGSLATPAVGGATRIFGGTHHEMDYPPRS